MDYFPGIFLIISALLGLRSRFAALVEARKSGGQPEGETRIACCTAGLHPGLGIVHTDKDGRASLVYDLMEAVRPTVDIA